MPGGNDMIPRIGLGTYGLTGDAGLVTMLSAIALGYRHLDTAQSGVSRPEFFVTTKITAANFNRLADSVDDSLRLMGLDHADLVLIHWPAPYDDPPVATYIGELARLQDRGTARLIE